MHQDSISDQHWDAVKHIVSRERLPSIRFPERIVRSAVAAALWMEDTRSDWTVLPPQFGDRHTIHLAQQSLRNAGALTQVTRAVRELRDPPQAKSPTDTGGTVPQTTPAPAEEPAVVPPQPAAARPEHRAESSDSTYQEPPQAETSVLTTEDHRPETETEDRYPHPVGPVPAFPEPDLALIRHLEHWINAHYYQAYVAPQPSDESHYFYHHFRPVLDLMYQWYAQRHPQDPAPQPALLTTIPDYQELDGPGLQRAILDMSAWIRDDITAMYTRIHEIMAVAAHGRKIPYRALAVLPTPAPWPPASDYDPQEAAALREPLVDRTTDPAAQERRITPPSHRPLLPPAPAQPSVPARSAPPQPAPAVTGRRRYAARVSQAQMLDLTERYAQGHAGQIRLRNYAQYLTDGPLSERDFDSNLRSINYLIKSLPEHFTRAGRNEWSFIPSP